LQFLLNIILLYYFKVRSNKILVYHLFLFSSSFLFIVNHIPFHHQSTNQSYYH